MDTDTQSAIDATITYLHHLDPNGKDMMGVAEVAAGLEMGYPELADTITTGMIQERMKVYGR